MTDTSHLENNANSNCDTSKGLLSPDMQKVADPVSPTSHSPHSDTTNRSAEMSASESDNEMSSSGLSLAKSLPLKRGAWSPQEDEKLVQLVETMQPLKWVNVAQEMRSRTSKQCRERYHNYLKPSLTRTPISKEEGRKIEELVAIHGKRWAEISRQLPGRSDNAIKNWWNAGINRRRVSQDHTPGSNMLMVKQASPAHQFNQSSQNSHSQYPNDHEINNSRSMANSGGPPPPVQPTSSERSHSSTLHVPPPVQVMFSSMYSEPNTRMHSPIYHGPQYAGQSPTNGQQAAPQHHHHHPHPHHHSSTSPYPLTSSQRAESRAESQARLSVTSLASIGSRSNSVVEDLRSISPAASPPPQPPAHLFRGSVGSINNLGMLSETASYSHNNEDPSVLFSRLRQNSDFRKSSVDGGRTDATSLSHYSLNNPGSNCGGLPSSRRPSVQPHISAELASPQTPQSPQVGQESQPTQSPKTSRLSISNLMNH